MAPYYDVDLGQERSSYGLVPDDTKPSPLQMLHWHQQDPVGITWWLFRKRNLSHQFLKLA